MRKRLQIFCLLLLPCLTLMGILGRGSPAALSASSDAAIPALSLIHISEPTRH